MGCTCRDTLRADAERLLEQSDRMQRQHPRNAEHSRRHAMALALAVGHLTRHDRKGVTRDDPEPEPGWADIDPDDEALCDVQGDPAA